MDNSIVLRDGGVSANYWLSPEPHRWFQ